MANKTGANLIIAVRQEVARASDSVLITETFVLDALNNAQIDIVRRTPRLIAMDKDDKTTYQVSSAKTVAISGLARSSNVVTATTSEAHLCLVGQKVTLTDVDSGSETNAFAGEFTIASVPTTTTFTYSQTGADESNLAAGTSNAYSFYTGTLDPAHIGGIWILNGSSTRKAGVRHRPLPEFNRKWFPVAEEGDSEPWEYARRGKHILWNCPVGSDYNALYLHLEYTSWATDLADDTTASELERSNRGLILYAKAECYDAMAVAMPRFEAAALKTRTLYEKWLREYQDENELALEELYNG